jgi:ABC-2 type transport system permease protein
MNSESTDQKLVVSAQTPVVRPFYWSVWREVWENRSLYVAPLIVAVVVALGFLASSVGLPERRAAVLMLGTLQARAAIEVPYDVAAMMLSFTAFVVGVFYSLDALYGERRDRSILFWKSLPVSDLTTVLSKATIPLAVLPLIVLVIIIATQLVMLFWTSGLLIGHGMSPGSTWTTIPWIQNWVVLVYGLIMIALWHAPIYGWALLVSSMVRNAAFLWAVLPLAVIGIFERITFGTSYFTSMLKQRVFGFAPGAFSFVPKHEIALASFSQLTPGKYLSSPGLWIGLVVAALFIAAAIRLRRYRGPL